MCFVLFLFLFLKQTISTNKMDEQDEVFNIQLAHIKKKLDELRVAFESLQSDLALHKKVWIFPFFNLFF